MATIPTTVKGEYLRATAAEAALSARIAKLEAAVKKVVGFTPTMSASQLLTLIADNTIDKIELDGRYNLPQTLINIERTRPVLIEPAAGAIAIFNSGNCQSGNQFGFGAGGVAGLIQLQNIILDGYRVNDTGLIWAGNCHDITVNRVTIRNCTAGLSSSSSWGLYVSSDAGKGPVNLIADDWTVDGNGRAISALQSNHDPNGRGATFRRWNVSHAGYAVYLNSDINNVILDGWSVSDTGVSGWNGVESIIAVGTLGVTAGTISNFLVTTSGGVRIPSLIDAGNNVW